MLTLDHCKCISSEALRSTHFFLCSLAFLDHWPLNLRKHNDSYIALFAYMYLIIYAFLEGHSPPEGATVGTSFKRSKYCNVDNCSH